MARYGSPQRDEWDDEFGTDEYELTPEEQAALDMALGELGGVSAPYSASSYGQDNGPVQRRAGAEQYPEGDIWSGRLGMLAEQQKRYDEVQGRLGEIGRRLPQVPPTIDGDLERDSLMKEQATLQNERFRIAASINTMTKQPQARPSRPDEIAKRAYDKALAEARLTELGQYGLAGRPKAPAAPSAASLAALQKLYWEQQRYPEEQSESKRRWEAGMQWNKDERALQEEGMNRRKQLEIEDAERRSRLAAAVNLSGDIGQQQARMLPYAVDPSWTSYPGFEAGGSYEQLVKMGGGTYTPYKIPRQEFDPLQAWRLAQGQLGVK